ncbi:hypothetical protein Cgig2_010839 [Carnegiea gigantea]|uniref:Uncharacterized protein n=1 Tax=Carnegiea gigantea TaxID=171969 RepID=A0A9Q1JT41_9CARY|nr:hypothetical protein Cgig2_010839 [Carnegiea gigantea]
MYGCKQGLQNYFNSTILEKTTPNVVAKKGEVGISLHDLKRAERMENEIVPAKGELTAFLSFCFSQFVLPFGKEVIRLKKFVMAALMASVQQIYLALMVLGNIYLGLWEAASHPDHRVVLRRNFQYHPLKKEKPRDLLASRALVSQSLSALRSMIDIYKVSTIEISSLSSKIEEISGVVETIAKIKE